MKEFCFATNNNYKLKEVRSILASKVRVSSLQDIGCHDELDETQLTIEGNSLQKAEYIFRKFHIPCFADDTGLEVEALGGAPGVISARYAGEHRSDNDNIQLLIKNLENKPNRNARFRTVVTLMNETSVHVFEGILRGTILTEKKGNSGFGYDPVFRPTGYTQTLAEMTAEQKNTISHRAIAMNKLFTFLINNS